MAMRGRMKLEPRLARPKGDSVVVGRGYQAWVPPQWGQPTEVDTCASNTNPQWQA
jgi:hypothetical protein